MDIKIKKTVLAGALLIKLGLASAYSVGTVFHVTNLTNDVVFANGIPILLNEKNKKILDLSVKVDWHNVTSFERDVDLFHQRGNRICHVSTFVTSMPTGVLWPSITSAYAHSNQPDHCVTQIKVNNPRTIGMPSVDVFITVQ